MNDGNNLEVNFRYINKEFSKVDEDYRKLKQYGRDFGEIGNNLKFGDDIRKEFGKAGSAFDDIKKGITDSLKSTENALDSVKKKVEDSFQKPTISRYWEAEEKKALGSLKAIEAAVSKTNSSLSNTGSTLPKTNSFPENKGVRISTDDLPKIKFDVDEKNFIDLDKLQKKAEETRVKFAQIATTRLSSGQIGTLTKEVVVAHERSKQLEADIRNIKSELQKTNSKSSIRFLTDELKAAEKEAEVLNRKLSSLPSSTKTPNGTIKGGKKNGLTDFDRTLLEVTDDFAPAGSNRVFNAVGREILAVNAISLTTLATFGAIAAAGYLIVDASSKAREQAEKRLLNEQLISGAINKQVLGLRDAFSEYEKFKRSLGESESFSNRISSAVNTSDANAVKREREKIDTANKSRIEEVNRLQAQLAQNERSLEFTKSRSVNQNLFTELGIGREYTASQKQQDVSQAERAAEKTRKALAETETALEKGKINLQQADRALIDIRDRQNKAFSNRFENFQKSQKDSQNFETRQFDELEKKKKKIAEIPLLKAEFNTFAAESTLSSSPFVRLFADADSAGERMEKRFRSLGDEYVKLATVIERNNIAKKINALSYESESRALTSEQNAIKTSRIRDNELGGFQRALETVDRKVDFAVKMFELNRKLDESDFYAYKYNPNNPKSFDQSRFSFAERDRFAESAGGRRRGESLQDYERRRQEAVATGIRVNDAFGEINKLKNFSLDGTGIFGEGIIADKILERLPSREDLLRLLSSPYISEREKAQSLLGEQSNALRTKRDLETRKLQDFIYDQQTKGLNQKFADENLNLLNKQQFLSPLERAKAKVDILSPLGNDVSPQQKRDLYENQLAVAKYERRQKDDAAELIKTIKDLIAGGSGVPVNIKGGTFGFDDASKTALENSANGSLEIILKGLEENGAKVTGKSLTAQSTKDYFNDR